MKNDSVTEEAAGKSDNPFDWWQDIASLVCLPYIDSCPIGLYGLSDAVEF